MGEFDRDVTLGAQFTFSSVVGEPGLSLKVRGHEAAHVDWLAEDPIKQSARGGRGLKLSNQALYWIILLLFIVAQYFFYTRVDIPPLGDLAYYVALLIASALPMVVVLLCLKAQNWLIPQFEPLPADGETRWHRHRARTLVAMGSLVTSVVLPLMAAALKQQLNLA